MPKLYCVSSKMLVQHAIRRKRRHELVYAVPKTVSYITPNILLK